MNQKLISLFFALMLTCLSLIGCQSEQDNIDSIRSYADPVADRMLQALSQDNYADFSSQFGQAMKERIPEAEFHKLSASIKGGHGTYVSKAFYNVSKNSDSVTVTYLITFTQKTEAMTLYLVLDKTDGSGSVMGFDLNEVVRR